MVEAQRSPQPRAPATGKLISGLCLILGYLILGLVSARAIPSLGLNIPFWPPSGLAIALVLVEGLVLLPAVTAGALLTNLQLIGGQLGPALLIALAHTAATAIVVLLARRLAGKRPALRAAREIVPFLLVIGPLSGLVAASLAVLVEWQWQLLTPAQLLQAWFLQWSGESLGAVMVVPLVLMLLPGQQDNWNGRRLQILLPSGIALLLALLAYSQAIRLENIRLRTQFQQLAAQAASQLNNNINLHSAAIDSVRRFVQTSPTLTVETFQQFSREAVQDLPGLKALSWNPLILADEREAFVQQQRRDPQLAAYELSERQPNGTLIKAKARERYVPVALIEPLAANRAALGYDILSEPLRAQAIGRSQRTGSLQATEPIGLVQGRSNRKGALLVLPVKSPRGATQGYAVGVFSLDELLRSSFPGQESSNWQGLELELINPFQPDAATPLASFSPARLWDAPQDRPAPAWAQIEPVTLGGQLWQLRLIPSQAAVQARQSTLPNQLLLACGLMLISNQAFLLMMSGQRQLERRQAAISHYEASHDHLTGLLNRRSFLMALEQAHQEARQGMAEHVLLAIDLDHFKPVNDEAGHAAGDRLLQELAQRMQAQLRQDDVLARMGGDEFAAILRLCPLQDSEAVARGLLQTIASYSLEWGRRSFQVTASIGIQAMDQSNSQQRSAEALLDRVDQALYQAKRNGRNTLTVVTCTEQLA